VEEPNRKSPVPFPPAIPDLAGKRGWNPGFPIRPESGIGNRESGNPPIPDSAWNGKRGPATAVRPCQDPRARPEIPDARASKFESGWIFKFPIPGPPPENPPPPGRGRAGPPRVVPARRFGARFLVKLGCPRPLPARLPSCAAGAGKPAERRPLARARAQREGPSGALGAPEPWMIKVTFRVWAACGR
jgi:hypothetical protein